MSKRSHTFTTVVTQIITFSLNLGTSNKEFQNNQIFAGKIFSEGIRISKKKIVFRNLSEKHCVLTLNTEIIHPMPGKVTDVRSNKRLLYYPKLTLK